MREKEKNGDLDLWRIFTNFYQNFRQVEIIDTEIFFFFLARQFFWRPELFFTDDHGSIFKFFFFLLFRQIWERRSLPINKFQFIVIENRHRQPHQIIATFDIPPVTKFTSLRFLKPVFEFYYVWIDMKFIIIHFDGTRFLPAGGGGGDFASRTSLNVAIRKNSIIFKSIL